MLALQGIDLKAGGRNKKVHRTAPKSDNPYIKLLVKVRPQRRPQRAACPRWGLQPRLRLPEAPGLAARSCICVSTTATRRSIGQAAATRAPALAGRSTEAGAAAGHKAVPPSYCPAAAAASNSNCCATDQHHTSSRLGRRLGSKYTAHCQVNEHGSCASVHPIAEHSQPRRQIQLRLLGRAEIAAEARVQKAAPAKHHRQRSPQAVICAARTQQGSGASDEGKRQQQQPLRDLRKAQKFMPAGFSSRRPL